MFAVSLAYILYNPLRVHHDCAMFLQVGSLLLDGRHLYVDVVDLNPPLISYLNMVPAAVSRALGTHLIPTFLLGVWGLTILSVAATRSMLRATLDDDEAYVADLIAIALAMFHAAVLRRNLYGQREHLFIIAFWPYLALRYRRWQGGPVPLVGSLMGGALAGVAACLKPYFVAIAVAPELYWAWSRRTVRPWLNPETFAFAAAGLVYGVHFVVAPEPMRAAFFGRWLPLVARGYHAYDMSLGRMLVGQTRLWLPAALSAVILWITGSAKGALAFARPVAVVAAMSVAVWFAQHKGWDYHAIPAESAAIVAVALLIGAFLSAPVRRLVSSSDWAPAALFGASAVMLVAFAALAAVLAVQNRTAQQVAEQLRSTPAARAIARYSRPGDPVLFLATSTTTPYPLLTQVERQPASRFTEDFPIPLLYSDVSLRPGDVVHYRTSDAPEEERRFLADLHADIDRFRPTMILIDNRDTCDWCPAGFGMYEYLQRNHFIAEALSRYRESGNVGTFVLYLPDRGQLR